MMDRSTTTIFSRDAINGVIEEAILKAEKKGVKVLSFGLHNQGEELNRNGELYLERHDHELRVKLVDGSGLTTAVVFHAIPKGTIQVPIRGNLNRVALTIARLLCEKGIQVAVARSKDYEKLRRSLCREQYQSNCILSKIFSQKVWLVGDGLTDEDQSRASERTLFIPFSQFPPKHVCKDCIYRMTPATVIPSSLKNMHSCENWLPRKVMKASRVAGILHALEGWYVNECGNTAVFDVKKAWDAALLHNFRLLPLPTT